MWLTEKYLLEFFQMWMSSRIRSWLNSVIFNLYRVMWKQNHYCQWTVRWWQLSFKWWLWQFMSDWKWLRLFLKLHWCFILHSQLYCYQTIRNIEDSRRIKHGWSLLCISALLSEIFGLHWHIHIVIQLFFSWNRLWQVYQHHLWILKLSRPRNKIQNQIQIPWKSRRNSRTLFKIFYQRH